MQPRETCCPFWGRRKHGLIYGLLISEFCFSKVKCNILLPPPLPPPTLSPSTLAWSVMGTNKGGNLKTFLNRAENSQRSGKLQMLLLVVVVMGTCSPRSSRWSNPKTQQQSSFLRSSLVAEMVTKPGSFFPINLLPSSPFLLTFIWPFSCVNCQVLEPSPDHRQSPSSNRTNQNHIRNTSLIKSTCWQCGFVNVSFSLCKLCLERKLQRCHKTLFSFPPN